MGIISRQEKASDPINMNCLMSKFLYDGGEYEVYTQCNTWQNESCGGWQSVVTSVSADAMGLRNAYGSVPFFAIWNNQADRGVAFHIMTRLPWRFEVKNVPTQGEANNLEIKVGINEYNFWVDLESGDEMELPEILYYEIRNKLDLDCLDNDRANDFAHKMSTELLSLLDDKKPYLGLGFLPASIQFNSAADAGRKIGATPDGRCDGAPLCESLVAIYSKDILGPTALLNSVVSLDLKRALGIPVLNFTISPKFDDSLFKALILGYMDSGGIHMQVTCTTYEILLEAYHNPELHRNLVVRVGGYSEYFNNLSDESKRLIINRMIYG